MKVYLAGPMRGYAQYNFPAFDEAAKVGRELGHVIVSPAEMDRDNGFDEKTATDADVTKAFMDAAFSRDVDAIIRADAIAMLPGWHNSKGSRAEKCIAELLGREVLDARTFEPLASWDCGKIVPRMTRDDYLRFHEDLCAKALSLSKRKNHDYAGAGDGDPFANFRRCETLGICSTQQGFLVRLTDKLSRLATFCAAGRLQVADESVQDTIIDVINYACLLAAFLEEEKVATGREIVGS